MKVQCSKCKSKYKIKDDKILDGGAKIKCPKCQNNIQVMKPKLEIPKVVPINGVESDNKKCPFCAEKIKADAIKCRYCGEWLKSNEINDAIDKKIIEKHPLEFKNDSIEETISNCEKKKSFSTFKGNIILKIAVTAISIIFIIIGLNFFSTFGKINAKKAYNNNYKQKPIIAKNSSNSNNEQKQNVDIEKLLHEAAAAIKNRFPIMYDEYTRLDSISAVKNKLIHRHTAVKHKYTEIDMNRLKIDAMKRAKHSTCSNEKTRRLLQYGADFVFIYYDKDGYKMVEFKIDSKSCED